MKLLEPNLANRLAADPFATRFTFAVELVRQAEKLTPNAAVEMLARQMRHGLPDGGSHILKWAWLEAQAHTEAGLNETAVEIADLEREADFALNSIFNVMGNYRAEEASKFRARAAHMRTVLAEREAAVAAMLVPA